MTHKKTKKLHARDLLRSAMGVLLGIGVTCASFNNATKATCSVTAADWRKSTDSRRSQAKPS
jgi:predicted ribosomally synthesized peptide with SipW-like signal peptide